ncbi:DsbA family oxidoreductase [Actinomyces sp. 2119]|uniref:DsbA family oxidoreductase n=1 Tax=Actinomyces lilanjuaniae TaxID=2321394 RepID=A0ABN5PTH7_9ACTO|nr:MULTISPECIES: DsbA family oxidoreductase [Actinomyces]AYD90200.1 DsbA family oxidoreductase [Actinomyces lilanjuaniae]RJF41457.1 DsbA family oxidoreductase [Actinomyces sp. 2119]
MKVTYWSDYACPYCYIGRTRLGRAIDGLGLADEVEFEMKSFELYPDAPYEVQGATVDRFARKYHLTTKAARQRVEAISRLGRAEGIDFNYATTLNTNMLDAHRLTKLAHDLGVTGFEELCFHAYFVDNEVMADHDVLRRLAAEAGLPSREVERVLAGRDYADAVRADEREAHEMGVSAVPYFVVDDTYVITGSRPTEEMARVLYQASAETLGRQDDSVGGACGPQGCALP